MQVVPKATPAPEKTVAEFFAGIGLMRLGLERGGWSTIYANDIEPEKREIYRALSEQGADHFELGDIHAINPRRIPSVALATASFPCNDLSLAGMRKGLNGAQSSAFWGFTRLISGMKERRPALLLIENVTGFLTSNGGADFESAMQALNRLGYDVDPFIIDAAHFVPQSRRRLFVVARRHKSRKLREADYESEVRPNVLSRFMVDHPGIRWAIRKLPALPRRTHNLESILEDLPDQAPEWWSEQRANYLLAQMSERHRRIASQMIEKNTWSYGTVFRRVRNAKSMAELRTDGVAGCLRTPRGGSGRQILFKAGKGRYQARLLTSAECARLMGVKHFAVDVPLHQALFGFGDAVCVSVIEWIARHYLNPLYAEMLKGDEVPAAGRRSRILARKERGFPLR